jgi:PEP-CTERM motif
MRRLLFWCGSLAIGFGTSSACADGISASALLTPAAVGGEFDYTITLTNSSSSTDPIGTFWFAWVPGHDFMPDNPTNILAPAGWNEQITHGASPDGYAIQYVASSTAFDLAPGSSLSGFGFTSPDSPAILSADTTLIPDTPILTSFVYNGAPFSAVSDSFVVQLSVPEPSTLTLGLFGLLGACAYARLKRRRAARLAA